MRTIKYIVLHCTASPQKQTVEQILAFFKNVKKWRNPGYHYIIRPDGSYVNTCPIENIANGVAGHNANSIHISYIGGIDAKGKGIDNRTTAQKATQVKLLTELKKKFPNAEILGHRDLSPDLNHDGIIQPWEWVKECPSFDVRNWLKSINFKV
ncbi:TPA: N-acetylmuramoyl-L-alanine amidase [Elizabethkingia anophelis]